MRRIHLLILLTILCLAALPFASTQDASTLSEASTMSSAQIDDLPVNQQASQEVAAPAENSNLNSSDFTGPDFRGTPLEKAYQAEAEAGWHDPNLTKSTGIAAPGGQ